MNYSEVIKKGWGHAWNNKFLWALGFLAALGNGSSFNSTGNFMTNQSDPAAVENMMTPESMAAMTGLFIALLCVGFVLGIIFWLVSLGARGGLIGGVAQLELGTGTPSFGTAFRMGWRKVGRLAGMTIALYIIPTILFVVGIVLTIVMIGGLAVVGESMEDPSIALTAFGGVSLVFLCLLCLIVPVLLVLGLIYPFAYRGIVLRDMGIRESLRHGWATLKENLGEILILGFGFWLIGFFIGIIVLAILAPIALIVGVPFLSMMQSGATVTQGVLAGLGVLLGMVITALFMSIYTAWQSSTFTVAYLQWTGKAVVME